MDWRLWVVILLLGLGILAARRLVSVVFSDGCGCLSILLLVGLLILAAMVIRLAPMSGERPTPAALTVEQRDGCYAGGYLRGVGGSRSEEAIIRFGPFYEEVRANYGFAPESEENGACFKLYTQGLLDGYYGLR